MNLKAPFFLREQYTRSILELLQKTTLGTNGARYRHLDTTDIIDQLDNPLFLSLERNERVIGNITFCRRKKNWYIRYFAFDVLFQSKRPRQKEKSGALKTTIRTYLNELNEHGIHLYAYIEANNIRSQQLSELFGFNCIGKLTMHTFSRRKAKQSPRLVEITSDVEKAELSKHFKGQLFYSDYHPARTKTYGLRDQNDQLVAFCRVQTAHWKIERLPGKAGKLLVRMLPFIPVLRTYIRPNQHEFLAVDMVYATKSEDLSEMLESVLAKEKQKLLFWWLDEKDKKNHFELNWGIFRYFLAKPNINVMAKSPQGTLLHVDQIFFVEAMDLI